MSGIKSPSKHDALPSRAQRIAYHAAGAVVGVPLGICALLIGVAMGFGGEPYWVWVPTFVALGIGFGFVGPAMLAGAIAGATGGGLDGAWPITSLLLVGGLIGIPLGFISRRRLWIWFHRRTRYRT